MTVTHTAPVRADATGETGRLAAQAVKPKAVTLEARCYAIAKERPCTPDEAHARIEREDGKPTPLYSIRPRFSQLARKGLLEDTGERRVSSAGRCKSIVWRVTPEEGNRQIGESSEARDRVSAPTHAIGLNPAGAAFLAEMLAELGDGE